LNAEHAADDWSQSLFEYSASVTLASVTVRVLD